MIVPGLLCISRDADGSLVRSQQNGGGEDQLLGIVDWMKSSSIVQIEQTPAEFSLIRFVLPGRDGVGNIFVNLFD